MRRILSLSCLLLLPSCSRDPVAASDDGPPHTIGRPPDRGPGDLLRQRDLSLDFQSPTDPGSCQPGDRRWCDGLQYSGWGQVACDPATGKWKTKLVNGKEIHDCQELANGGRPNTVCACYHAYFNPSCCEQPDCIVPAGSQGQSCPKSPGKLCDYCNPQHSECAEPQAKCIVTNSHETFCGRLCSPTQPCSTGYQCMVVKLAGAASTNQCVPSDLSCYY